MTTATRLPELDPKPPCELVGKDGNAFAIIGRVRLALRRAGHPDYADEWSARAMACGSYDELLALTFEYVEDAG